MDPTLEMLEEWLPWRMREEEEEDLDFHWSQVRDWLQAEIPNVRIHVLIVESTYGVMNHEPREQREHRFTNSVHQIVRQGGKCLLPVFALGRAQEILLILEDYWA
eukprot:s2957_g1.t4